MKNHYSLSQITLHWLTLLMIVLTYSAMLLSDSVPDEDRALVKNLHFNFGISVWILMLARLWLRHRNPIRGSHQNYLTGTCLALRFCIGVYILCFYRCRYWVF